MSPLTGGCHLGAVPRYLYSSSAIFHSRWTRTHDPFLTFRHDWGNPGTNKYDYLEPAHKWLFNEVMIETFVKRQVIYYMKLWVGGKLIWKNHSDESWRFIYQNRPSKSVKICTYILIIPSKNCGLCTLVCRIDVHERLLILSKKFPLHGLIWVCTFIDSEKKIPPTRLFRSNQNLK